MRLKNVIVTLIVTMLSAAGASSPASGQFGLDDASVDAPSETAAPSLTGFNRLDGPVIVEAADPSVDVESPEVQATVAEIQQRNDEAEAARLDGLSGQTQVPTNRAASGGGLFASFDAGVPSNVRNVVNAAIADWDAALETPVPVNVRVFWQCFNSPGLLGFAGPTDIYVEGGLIYPASLANNLAGSDLNGATAEIEITLNAELTLNNTCVFEFDDWYISTNTNPTSSQIDLYSVVLHEVGHGLGFLGSAQDPDGSGFAQAQLSFPRFVYDTFVYAGSVPLLSAPSPNSQLTGNNLFFDIGGERFHRVYAPSTFQNGSSFSHFDTIYFGGDPGELMTPALGPGEVRRSLDGPVLGLLAQQGWGIVPRAITPSISLSTSPGQIDVSWQPNLASYGTPPLTYTVRAFANGTLAAQKTVDGGEDGTALNQLTNGLDYTIEVTPNDIKGGAAKTTADIRLPAYPNPPKYVQSNGVGLVRTVRWELPEPSGGGPETYTVQARQLGANWSTIGTTSNASITTPTLAEQPYQFRVRATNADGNGEYSYSTIIGASDTIVRPFPLDGQVARLYSAYFLREPDQAGFDYWLGQRASGVGLSSISAAFAKSPEFIDRYGSLSNSQFVEQVYQNVTGRTPDAGGKAFWIAYLEAGNSRGAMMIGFSESAEYQTGTGTVAPTTSSEGKIYRLYLAFFLREPDADGLSFWTGELNGGRTFGSIADGFVGSAEFQAEYGSLSNDRFVELVYANVLIRPPDSAGYDFWLDELESGSATRGQMMAQFAESLEFVLRTGSLP